MITRQDIDTVVERIAALYDPDRIYLFGSHAKGRATAGSDLDLVVVRASDEPRYARGRDVGWALRGTAFRMDLLFVTPGELAEELADPYSVYSRIMAYAVPVYARLGVVSGHDAHCR